MEFKFSNNTITINKTLSDLDLFVLNMTNTFSQYTNYVIVSGYIPILFGRVRTTEDVDMLISFKGSCERLSNSLQKYNILNSTPNSFCEDITHNPIRVAQENMIFPNLEVKLARKSVEHYALANKILVILNGKSIFISPLELQIAFKLYLGSNKDIEDAYYLYNLFKDYVDSAELQKWTQEFKVSIDVLNS